jgi:hypothetical protein
MNWCRPNCWHMEGLDRFVALTEQKWLPTHLNSDAVQPVAIHTQIETVDTNKPIRRWHNPRHEWHLNEKQRTTVKCFIIRWQHYCHRVNTQRHIHVRSAMNYNRGRPDITLNKTNGQSRIAWIWKSNQLYQQTFEQNISLSNTTDNEKVSIIIVFYKLVSSSPLT